MLLRAFFLDVVDSDQARAYFADVIQMSNEGQREPEEPSEDYEEVCPDYRSMVLEYDRRLTAMRRDWAEWAGTQIK
ncbi:hypothetical protein ACWEOI_13325 [Nocardia sp. NPDC004340]